MRKGDLTRQAILDRATGLASTVGLEGLTIGALATDLRLSKSGLFAHFHSKESLQLQVLEHGAAAFVTRVIRPALAEPRGAPRMRALFERWLDWAQSSPLPGGCLFVQASVELDDRPGPVRDRLVEFQRQWFAVIVTSMELGIRAGAFHNIADPEQFAQDLYGVMLAYHHASRLLRDPRAEARARRAFDVLLNAALVPVEKHR
jgi:AcrR family transcriptional regulator